MLLLYVVVIATYTDTYQYLPVCCNRRLLISDELNGKYNKDIFMNGIPIIYWYPGQLFLINW